MATSTTTYLQGSLIAAAAFTIRTTDDVSNPGETDSDLSISAGDEWASVDEFLADWSAQLVSDLGADFDVSVNADGADVGKVTFTTGTGNDYDIAWAHAGDSDEAEKFRNFLGATGDISEEGDNHTFTNPHAAGLYPALAASAIARSTTSHTRGQGTRLGDSTLADLGSWTQHNTSTTDQGRIDLQLDLQLDCRANWSELYAVQGFVDDLFDNFGEPFSINHGGSVYTVFFSASPLEVFAQRRVEGWNDLMSVSFTLDGSQVADS